MGQLCERRQRRLLTTLSLLVAGGVALARQQAPPPPLRPPVFRGESVLVTVDAYPQRDGVIVPGLKAQDFQVSEDGKPQTVESVEFVRVEPGLPEAMRRDPGSVGEMLKEAADPRTRLFVVFLDQLHVQVGGSFRTRRPLVDALDRIIAPNDLFAMMTQNTDPRALTFGRRLISVEDELTRYWDWGRRGRIADDPTDPMEDRLRACYECRPGLPAPCPNWYVSDGGQKKLLSEALIERRREDRTLTALEKLVAYLRGLREARTVVLAITEGWRLFLPRDDIRSQADEYGPHRKQVGTVAGRLATGLPTGGDAGSSIHECQNELVRLSMLDNDSRFRTLITNANQTNVSFYPANPSGLQVFDTPISEKEQPTLKEDASRLRSRLDSMRVLAENTDGIAIVNTNDLAAGLKRVVDDVSAYYLLGYYSTNTTHDGRYRRIEVKTTAPGLTVRARRGYYAPGSKAPRETFRPAPAGAEPPKGMAAALGELGRIRASADAHIRGALAGDRALVVVELSSFRAGSTPWVNGADVRVAVTPEGAPSLVPVTARIDANARGALLSIPLGADTAVSARVNAKISAGGETVEETSEIGRSAAGLVGDAIVYRGRPAATSPLRAVADLQFRRTERVHVEWPLGADLDQRTARLLGRTGQPLAVPVTVTERETDGRKVIAADLNLAPLGAGEYLIELTVGRGAETAVRLIAFRLIQ